MKSSTKCDAGPVSNKLRISFFLKETEKLPVICRPVVFVYPERRGEFLLAGDLLLTYQTLHLGLDKFLDQPEQVLPLSLYESSTKHVHDSAHHRADGQ